MEGSCGNGAMCAGKVEIVNALHDWHAYLVPFNFDVHGIAIMQSEEAVNHAWRFIQRDDLRHYLVNGQLYGWDISSVLRKIESIIAVEVLVFRFTSLKTSAIWHYVFDDLLNL
jgi:hypothetical protein